MSWNTFPIVPEKRKVILVLNEADIEKCQYNPNDGIFLLDEESYVLRFPLEQPRETQPLALRNIMDSRLASPGHILIQNPYDTNLYVEASSAPETFALAKYTHFSMLCMHLGAKECSVEQIEIKSKNGKMTFAANGGTPTATIKGDISKEKFSRLSKQLFLTDNFNGSSPNIVDAENFLRTKGLLNDPNMKSLLDMRRGLNPIQKRTLTLNLSQEAKNNLNVATRLKTPAFVNLSADYSTILKEEYFFSVKINVTF